MKKWKNCLKRNSKIIVLFILLLGFSRCGWIFEDTRISPEKPPLLRIGDTIIFKNNCCVDSFYVKNSKLYLPGEIENDYEKYLTQMIQIDCADSCYSLGSTITPSVMSI